MALLQHVVQVYPNGQLVWCDGVPSQADAGVISPRKDALPTLPECSEAKEGVQWICLLNEARTRNGKYNIPHYKLDGYADDGPPAVDQLVETCRLIDEALGQGKQVAVFCPEGKEYRSHRAFSALCVAAHAILVRQESASKVVQLWREAGCQDIGFMAHSWVPGNANPGPPRSIRLACCLEALVMARDRKWIAYETFNTTEYLERWSKFDVAWFVPGEVLLLADPMSTVADPNPSTAKFLSPEGTNETFDPKSCFTDLFEADGVKLLVRLNLDGEMGMLKSYNPEVFEKRGIGTLDCSFVDLNGGTPSNDICKKILARSQQVPEGSAVGFHCKAGFGRSAVCAAILLMHRHDLPGDVTLAWLRMVRPGSITTLRQATYLQKLKGREDIDMMLAGRAPCCTVS